LEFGGWESGCSSALIDPAYPASRWYLPLPQWVGAFVNLVGLSLVRDVLLGVLFILWAAWWIAILVVLRAKPKLLPPLPRHDTAFATVGDLLSAN
jgi:hypothetical protein